MDHLNWGQSKHTASIAKFAISSTDPQRSERGSSRKDLDEPKATSREKRTQLLVTAQLSEVPLPEATSKWQQRKITTVPAEILYSIIGHLDAISLVCLKNTCTYLRASITKVPKGLSPCEKAQIHRYFSKKSLNDG